MTKDSLPATPRPAAPGRGRTRIVLAVSAAVLAAILVAAVVALTAGGGDDAAAEPSTAAQPTGSADRPSDTAAPPTPQEHGAGTGEAGEQPGAGGGDPVSVEDELPPTLPEVPLDASAAPDDGVVLTLPEIESVQATAQGPGNVGGPAIRVTIRIENGTGEALPLDGVAVNMFYGSESTPASPLEDRSRRPFVGELPAGAAAQAVYLFSVPEEQRDEVTVELGYRAGAPRAVFSGPLP